MVDEIILINDDTGERLLKLAEVKQKVSLSSTTIYRRISESTFPRPVKIGENSVRWKLSDIDAWIAALPTTAALR